MLAVIQRVSKASVSINTVVHSAIECGLLILLGVEKGDSSRDVDYLVRKIVELRIFNDAQAKMNRSLMDVGGSLLVVSQFTLFADTSKGRRPGFQRAADSETGQKLYQEFVDATREKGLPVQTGVFGAMMELFIVNDGPVTIIIDSRKIN